MSNQRYNVVAFTDDDPETLSIVIDSWTFLDDKNERFTYFPSAGLQHKLKRGESPTSTWQTHRISVLSKFDTLAEANTALEDASQTEEGSSDESSSAGPKKAVLPQPPATYKRKGMEETRKKGGMNKKMRQEAPVQGKEGSSHTCMPVGAKNIPQEEPQPMSEREFQMKVLTKLNMIIDIQSQNTLKEAASDVFSDQLPAKDVDDLKQLDGTLEEASAGKNFKSYIRTFGGKNPGEFMRRCFNHIATPEVLSRYSVHGKKGKLAFKTYNMYNIIIRMCVSAYNSTEKEAENAMGETLKHAPRKK